MLGQVRTTTLAAIAAMLLFTLGSPGAGRADAASTPAGTPPAPYDIRLGVGASSGLTIGNLPPFVYDGRGGSGFGYLQPRLGEPGMYDVEMPASAVAVPPLPMVAALPDLPVRVHIVPKDLRGTLDACSGEVELSFDATFTPEVFGSTFTSLSVVTPLTTGPSTVGGKSVTGHPLDRFGRGRLAGIAWVPRTGDVFVDMLLGLPTEAAAELDVNFDFAAGPPPCPSGPPAPPAVFMDIGKSNHLEIGEWPSFPYDGAGSGGPGTLTRTGPGRYDVAFDVGEIEVPALRLIPFVDFVRVEIQPRRLAGSVNVCTGVVELAFDATFQPVAFDFRPAAVSVVTVLTTESSSGFWQHRVGRRLDSWGDAFMVGVAKVPRTGDLLVDMLLGLPNDAVANLGVHFDLPAAAGECTPSA